jgi:hypothetical protein
MRIAVSVSGRAQCARHHHLANPNRDAMCLQRRRPPFNVANEPREFSLEVGTESASPSPIRFVREPSSDHAEVKNHVSK